jgi:hypothetical protein
MEREPAGSRAREELQALKARYFRLMDTKRWDEWADVFTEDLTAWVEDQPDRTYHGREDFVSSVSTTLAQAVTVHQGHMPELELDGWNDEGPTRATGIWAMFDYVEFPRPEGSVVLQGYGHYHETYRREDDGHWRIASLRLTRLRVDHRQVPASPEDAHGG